jgi:hypothetical protein
VDRYTKLIKSSKNFGSAFNEPQEYEKDKKSVTNWFEQRESDLKTTIKPIDYGQNRKMPRNFSQAKPAAIAPLKRAGVYIL